MFLCAFPLHNGASDFSGGCAVGNSESHGAILVKAQKNAECALYQIVLQ